MTTIEEKLLQVLQPDGGRVDIYGSSAAIMALIVDVMRAAREHAAHAPGDHHALKKTLANLDRFGS